MNAKVQEKSTLYAELITDPLIVATLSALIGVGLGMVATILYAALTHSRKRRSILGLLRTQLHYHGQQLNELGINLGKGKVCGALDPAPVLYFLNGDVVALPKDEKLVKALYKHLGNIEVIRRSIDIIGMNSAGWTSVHTERREALELNLREVIPECQAALFLCWEELKT